MSVIGSKIKDLDGKQLFLLRMIAILMVLISYVPLKIPLTSSFITNIDLMVVYFWSIYSDKFCSKIFLIFFGLVHDTIYGLPTGMTSFFCLLFSFVLSSERNIFHSESFLMMWLGFAVFSFFAVIFKSIIFFFLSDQIIFSDVIFYNWLISSLSYSIIHFIFSYKILKEKNAQ